ncbi:hypothetical protein IMZ48_28255, partial [Candidatus Bathyarchaeota archaeon]|nr:hypothetical protein [Candidatus Bathyarchaeota archaeon]
IVAAREEEERLRGGEGLGEGEGDPAPATPDTSYPYPRPEPADEAPAVAKRHVDKHWDYRQTISETHEDASTDAIVVAADRAGVRQGTPTRPDFTPGRDAAGGEFGQIPLEDPNRPLTHEEYVDSRIENERLPRGFVRIPSTRYILR